MLVTRLRCWWGIGRRATSPAMALTRRSGPRRAIMGRELAFRVPGGVRVAPGLCVQAVAGPSPMPALGLFIGLPFIALLLLLLLLPVGTVGAGLQQLAAARIWGAWPLRQGVLLMASVPAWLWVEPGLAQESVPSQQLGAARGCGAASAACCKELRLPGVSCGGQI